MRAAFLVLVAGCAGESHGGAPPPAEDIWYVRYPETLTSAGPLVLDTTALGIDEVVERLQRMLDKVTA